MCPLSPFLLFPFPFFFCETTKGGWILEYRSLIDMGLNSTLRKCLYKQGREPPAHA